LTVHFTPFLFLPPSSLPLSEKPNGFAYPTSL
jgi:hypothetical protein